MKKIILSLILIFMILFTFQDCFAAGGSPIDNRTLEEKLIDEEALRILCNNNGNFKALDEFMLSKGYIKNSNDSDFSINSAVPSYLNLSMERYVYTGYLPIRQKIFIYFDWTQYETNSGPPDAVGIAWDSSKYNVICSDYTAYDANDKLSDDLMWLSNTSFSAYAWGIYEVEWDTQALTGVDHGAAIVTLQANSSDYLVLGTMFGNYLHTYNSGSYGITVGFPFVIQVTYSQGTQFWQKAVACYDPNN